MFYHLRCFFRDLVPFLGLSADSDCRLAALLPWQPLGDTPMLVCVLLDKPLLSSERIVFDNGLK